MTSYQGFKTNDVIVIDDVRHRTYPLTPGPSQRLVNHSPDGFSWGFAGSGPSQLALAILLDFFTARCPYGGADRLALKYYSAFKWAVVARWPQDEPWQITGAEIAQALTPIADEGKQPKTRHLSVGQIVVTPGARKVLFAAGRTAEEFVRRHAACDWGDISDNDRIENEFAFTYGMRIISIYRVVADESAIYIITEADRRLTTIMLPVEY